jgi:AraC-like DNA-binding protein
MTPGRLCWLPPSLSHGFVSRGPVAGVSLKVAAPLCDGMPDDSRVLDADPFLAMAIQRLIGRPADFDGLWPVLRRAVIEAPDGRLSLPAPSSAPLARLAQDLMRDPADARDLDRWAQTLGLSPRTLMRRLKAETGLSFAVWRQRLRLMHSVAAMQAGASATTAALDAGFASASAFSAAFRKHVGLAPTAYLKGRTRDTR